MAELKPCPFCGNGAGEFISYNTFAKKTVYVVRCHKCNAEMRYRSMASARKAWNRRAGDGK